MTIHVSAERPYDVTVSRGCLAQLTGLVRGRRTAVVHAASLTALATSVAASLGEDTVLLDVPDGERAKTPETLADCWNRLAAAGFTRSDVVVGLGGGSTTDLAGFVAASWLRGVRYISVPTTVLAMVDAAVGGKTGINLSAGKNLVGAFYEPSAVLCDLELLASLPREEVSSGLAEVVKAGFIADARITDIVSADPAAATDVTSEAHAELIRLSIQMKADVVSVDLRERTGEGEDIGRESLNYGHTLGHAIEKYEHFGLRHGEAVSVGMVYVAEVALRLGLLDEAAVALHREQLTAVGLPTTYSRASWADLRATMSLDKKARGATLRLVLLDGLRHPVIVEGPDEDVLADAYAAIA
ncbi:MAG: 3-dehydroquinate synthase [Actinobacteria bacterium]|nr:3-dehydroquinate synthase [Actinomycetota bacterium]